jgi:hypothetical protein
LRTGHQWHFNHYLRLTDGRDQQCGVLDTRQIFRSQDGS